MRAGALRLAFAAWAIGVWAACGGDASVEIASPATPRATAVLEPPRIRVGDRAALEIAVVTPPGYESQPFEPPRAVAGFEILDAEALPIGKEASRWIHRTRIHLRARDVGRFTWPEGGVEVRAPDGTVARLPVEPLSLEVVSILPEFPNRLAPFGARAAPRPHGGAGVALPAAAGSLATLAAVGLVALARRRRRDRHVEETPETAAEVPPWTAAWGSLENARAALATDPAGAVDATAAILRRYMARRFGAGAEARTTEELELLDPPFAATSRWPTFVSLLRDLDELRFPPQRPDARAAAAARAEALVDRAEDFVAESTPPEPLR